MNSHSQRASQYPVSQFEIYVWAREQRRQWFKQARTDLAARCGMPFRGLRVRSQVLPCVIWFVAATSGVFAAEPKLALVCAERDVAAITLIEERADSDAVPSENVHRAFTTQMQARDACAAGRVGEALALYDRIGNEVQIASRSTTR
jgi:hypothetical protein